MAGLPRSGSTILSNILMQNPDIYVSETSNLPLFVNSIKNEWAKNHMNISKETADIIEKNVLRGLIQNYYEHIDKPIIIDKSRVWPSLIETLDWINDEPPKIIACVRDPRQIIESFEELYIKTLAKGMPPHLSGETTTIQQRAETIASGKGSLGSAYIALKDSIDRGHANKIHFARYESMGRNPAAYINEIYAFLKIDKFDHHYDNILQLSNEDDRIHGYDNLHDIEPNLRPAHMRKRLGEYGKKFEGLEFWL